MSTSGRGTQYTATRQRARRRPPEGSHVEQSRIHNPSTPPTGAGLAPAARLASRIGASYGCGMRDTDRQSPSQPAPGGGSVRTLRELDGALPHYINSRESDVIEVFYRPCLRQAQSYVRGAGYFRSSVFRLMTEELLDFCIRGGTMKLVTSTQMDISDFDAAVRAYQGQGFKADLEALLSNAATVEPTQMLCALIHAGRLEIFVAVLRDDIYHEKKGFFEDTTGHIVAFDGSGNETRTALLPYDKGNAESFNVIWNWEPVMWTALGSRWHRELQRAISPTPDLSFPIVHISKIDRDFIEHHNIDVLLESHREAARCRQQKLSQRWDEVFGSVKSPEGEAENQVDGVIQLRKHQQRGRKAWYSAGCKGILEHATGSGKTITALSIVREHLQDGGDAVVLVPSEALLHQWNGEFAKHLPDVSPALLGDLNSEGLEVLHEMRSPEGPPAVVLAIMHSFRSGPALQRFERAIKSSGRSMLLVVDECHKIGAPSFAPICATHPHRCLGLSATPVREGDPEGTARLLALLGTVVDTYALRDALADGHLTPYRYHVETVNLTSEEQQAYDRKRKEIRRRFARLPKGAAPPNDLKKLIFDARRIVRGAEGKVSAAVAVVKKHFAPNQHWLVYCEDGAMMARVEAGLRAALPEASINRYWSQMNSFQRQSALRDFERRDGVIIAIRCLDEGVDVPVTSHGIVLSSSKTRREFIQRRGRLLRKSDGKDVANIFDIFALPAEEAEEGGFLLDEIARGLDFAANAINRVVPEGTIKRIMINYGIAEVQQIPDPEDSDEE